MIRSAIAFGVSYTTRPGDGQPTTISRPVTTLDGASIRSMPPKQYHFEPTEHEQELVPIIEAIRRLDQLDIRTLNRLTRRHPKAGRGSFSKSELIRGFRHFAESYGWDDGDSFVERVRMKPIRTLSGVAPVTVLTKPFPCPGKCIFCPNDVRMPKSYLSREPGAQRAAQHDFDPYAQTLARLVAYHHTGHAVDKVELIILGGTWSFYPESYQVWFVKRCFDAMNDFERWAGRANLPRDVLPKGPINFRSLEDHFDGRDIERTYNQVVSDFLRHTLGGELLADSEHAGWAELEEVQLHNERATARCVGLVVETRPDHLSPEEVIRVRRLGCTKVQIGFQSLDDEVLRLNHRGHDVAATRRAVGMLRQAGFKIHAHWMPNLHGSNPRRDVEDFERLFADPDFRPDELKIYPCSLIETAELMQVYERGEWRPYEENELLEVLTCCLPRIPPWCRLTRVIRDIPGDDILVGNKTTNFRQVAEKELEGRGERCRDIRAREIRGRSVQRDALRLEALEYASGIGREIFFQMVTGEDILAGFCRLSLPAEPVFVEEIADSAMIREVHVYGAVVGIGDQREGPSQHLGLGRQLVEAAAERARVEGFSDLAVISSVGTRDYYRGLGFGDGDLYQHRRLDGA